MKKHLSVLLSACVLIMSVFLLSACGEKEAKEPVFMKNLISAEDMDVDIQYIADETWGKKVKSIDIPNMPKGMDTSFYDEEAESGDLGLHTIHFGVNSDDLNADYGLAKPFEFTQVQVTWDDGTSTMADVGQIQIKSIKEGDLLQNTGSSSKTKTMGELETEKYTATQDMQIISLEIPYKKQVDQICSDLKINEVPLDQISEKNPVKLSKGQTCDLSYTKKQTAEFWDIMIEAQLIGVDKRGKKQVTIVRLNQRLSPSQIGAYLRQTQQ